MNVFAEETADYVSMWDQTLINDGRLRYVQSEPNKTVDSMNFDVTNGVRTLRDLRIDFIVIPTALLLASNPLVVNEGKSKTDICTFSPLGHIRGGQGLAVRN
jgi:hypothetical protein